MASYVLLLKPGFDGVHVDSMLDVSAAVVPGVSFKDWTAAARVCDRIDGTDGVAYRNQIAVLHQVEMLGLRSRLDGACDGPFLLHCEREMSFDEMEQMVNTDPKFVQRLRGKRIRV